MATAPLHLGRCDHQRQQSPDTELGRDREALTSATLEVAVSWGVTCLALNTCTAEVLLDPGPQYGHVVHQPGGLIVDLFL